MPEQSPQYSWIFCLQFSTCCFSAFFLFILIAGLIFWKTVTIFPFCFCRIIDYGQFWIFIFMEKAVQLGILPKEQIRKFQTALAGEYIFRALMWNCINKQKISYLFFHRQKKEKKSYRTGLRINRKILRNYPYPRSSKIPTLNFQRLFYEFFSS